MARSLAVSKNGSQTAKHTQVVRPSPDLCVQTACIGRSKAVKVRVVAYFDQASSEISCFLGQIKDDRSFFQIFTGQLGFFGHMMNNGTALRMRLRLRLDSNREIDPSRKFVRHSPPPVSGRLRSSTADPGTVGPVLAGRFAIFRTDNPAPDHRRSAYRRI